MGLCRAWCSGVSMVVHRNIQLSAFSTVPLRSRSKLLSFLFELVDIHVPSTSSSAGITFSHSFADRVLFLDGSKRGLSGMGGFAPYTRFLIYALYPRRVRCDAAWAGLPLAFLYLRFEGAFVR